IEKFQLPDLTPEQEVILDRAALVDPYHEERPGIYDDILAKMTIDLEEARLAAIRKQPSIILYEQAAHTQTQLDTLAMLFNPDIRIIKVKDEADFVARANRYIREYADAAACL